MPLQLKFQRNLLEVTSLGSDSLNEIYCKQDTWEITCHFRRWFENKHLWIGI